MFGPDNALEGFCETTYWNVIVPQVKCQTLHAGLVPCVSSWRGRRRGLGVRGRVVACLPVPVTALPQPRPASRGPAQASWCRAPQVQPHDELANENVKAKRSKPFARVKLVSDEKSRLFKSNYMKVSLSRASPRWWVLGHLGTWALGHLFRPWTPEWALLQMASE